MGLINTYGAANRRINTYRTINYYRSPVSGSWSYTVGMTTTTLYQAWEYHRLCKLSYEYVGMNLKTAGNCAAALIAMFTRQVKSSKWNDTSATSTHEFVEEDGGDVMMAEVSIVHVGGKMYNVVVNVNEDDTRVRLNTVTSAASLFETENARTYFLAD